MSSFATILKLANKFMASFAEDVLDGVEPELYSGNTSSIKESIDGLQRAIKIDLNGTANQYHMHLAQVKQSQREAEQQKQLHLLAKELNIAIAEAVKSGSVDALRSAQHSINTEVKERSKMLGIKIPIFELQSFRIMNAVLKDEPNRALQRSQHLDEDWESWHKLLAPSGQAVPAVPAQTPHIDEPTPQVKAPFAPMDNRPQYGFTETNSAPSLEETKPNKINQKPANSEKETRKD